MAAACRFAAPLGLAPLPRKRIAFSVGSAKAAPRGVAMKAATVTSGGEETPETVGPLCCTGAVAKPISFRTCFLISKEGRLSRAQRRFFFQHK